MKFPVFTLLGALSAHAELVSSKLQSRIKIPKGLEIHQFADKSQVVNATTLCVDSKGAVYVSETHRWRKQVQDIRFGGKFMKERLHDDISIMTMADRTAFHKKWSGKASNFLKWEQFDDDSEVIKLLKDTNQDGKADSVSLFSAEDFNQSLAGPSSGLTERDGTVYFAMIPGIYSLQDLDGDGKAERVKTLVDGFGLRVSFSGHDLNGFVWGPDGKLYWSVGDRGFDVKQGGKRFYSPDSGAIFRANPDGSDFEIFAHNFRNPKELAFDKFGNLFTVDNDYDKGDKERIVYVVEDGDSGWKMGHQTIASFSNSAFNHMGPRKGENHKALDMWMAEGMWQPHHDSQPAHIIPPIANTVGGPCGFTFNPGVTGLPGRYDDRFFVASYVANPATSGIYSFTLKPDGASFKVDQEEWFLKGVALTDMEFGPDGKMYISDYGGGWLRPGRGGVFTLADDERIKTSELQDLRVLLAGGFKDLKNDKLRTLMGHPDQRVRRNAQYALAERGGSSLKVFTAATKKSSNLLRRIHGIWGLGQLAVKTPSALKPLASLLTDQDLEVRANAARTLGNHPKHLAPYRAKLITLLNDSSPRVSSLAALALANEGHSSSVSAAISLLERNAGKDVVVRHGGVMMLTQGAKGKTLAGLAGHSSSPVRRAAVVALRRQKSPAIAAFFKDNDLLVRQEAIRGAYDENIRETFPQLSALAHEVAKRVKKEDKYHPMTARRAMHAAWTLGRAKDVSVIADIANDPSIDFRVRRDAVTIFLDWNKPPVADPVTAFVRKLPGNRTKVTRGLLTQLKPLYESAIKDHSAARLLPWSLKLLRYESLPLDLSILQKYAEAGWVRDIARVMALEILADRQKDKGQLAGVLQKLVSDKNTKVRSKARELFFKIDPAGATELLGEILADSKSSLTEKQLTLETLADLKTPKAKALIESAMDTLLQGAADPGLALDILTAGEKMNSAKVATFRASFKGKKPLAEWFALTEKGGNIQRGKRLYNSHGTAQCQRCHMMNGVGSDVGPELAAIGKKNDEAYLLRALITPNSEIAVGYGLGSITLKDGTVVSGNIMADDQAGNARVKIGKEIKTLKKSSIKSRSAPMSAMPPMAGILTQAEVRDVVAYLRSCKVDRTDEGHK